jgi:hypothetical protein
VRGRNDDRAKAREAWRRNSNNMSLRIYDRATNGGWLQSYVQADVRSERRASPRVPLGRHEADNAESGDRTASPSAANNQREIAGLQGFDAAEFCNACHGVGTLQDGEVRRSIAACKLGSNNPAIWQGHLYFFVAPKGMLGRYDNSGAPNHAARRTA